MSLNSHLESILGKKVVGVITKERNGSPVYQVFIIFDDNTYFEFSGNDIHNGKGLRRGGIEEIKNYMPDAKIMNEFYNENL